MSGLLVPGAAAPRADGLASVVTMPPAGPPPPRPTPSRVLMDAAAGLPLHPVGRDVLLAALDDGWADPRRLYHSGRRARMLLDGATEQLAALLGARPDEVGFTPSGTTALLTAVLGAARARRRVGRLLAVSAVEHTAVLRAAWAHDADGGATERLAVDGSGRLDLGAAAPVLARTDLAAVAVQSANHEVGTCQPLDEVVDLLAGRGVPLVVDAGQTVPWATPEAGWSVLTGSARVWGGPGGVGVLAVRTGTRFAPPWPTEADDVGGRFPGRPDLPSVLAAVAALQAVRAEAGALAPRLSSLVERLRTEIPRMVPDTVVLGDPVRRLPHLVTASCLYADSEGLLLGLDAEGLEVSSGSSCTSSLLEPSHVLAAMGALTHGNVRVSLHRGSTDDDVDRLLAVLPAVVEKVRAAGGAVGL